MKRHSYEMVQTARYWHDNSRLGYKGIADLLADLFGVRVGVSTVRDWVNQQTRVFR